MAERRGLRRVAERPTRACTRTTGAVYLLYFLTAVLGELCTARAGIGIGAGPADTAATAATVRRLLAHEAWFQVGFALGLVSIACYVVVTALLYRLFRHVSGGLALLAMLFSLLGLAVQATASAYQLGALLIVGSDRFMSVFPAAESRALAVAFLNSSDQVYGVGLVLDGLFLALIGYVIARSDFLPGFLGVLIMLAGLGWLTNAAPPLARHVHSLVVVLGVVAEASLMLWLVIGANPSAGQSLDDATDGVARNTLMPWRGPPGARATCRPRRPVSSAAGSRSRKLGRS
jgi:hypothetical protein